MSLTSATEIKLKNAGLTEGFKKHRAIWLGMARNAYAYTKTEIADPKKDDVAPHLALALEGRDEFLTLRAEQKIRARGWFRDFADYIIEKTWDEAKQPKEVKT